MSFGGGRRNDPLWNKFKKIENKNKTGFRAVCLKCNYELQGVLDRIRRHLDSRDVISLEPRADNSVNRIHEPQQCELNPASASTSCSTQSHHPEPVSVPIHRNVVKNCIENFVVKTSQAEKEKLDEQAARFFYEANLPFLKAEGAEFKNFCNKLRPGYTPPSSKQLSNELLDKVYDK